MNTSDMTYQEWIAELIGTMINGIDELQEERVGRDELINHSCWIFKNGDTGEKVKIIVENF